MPENEMLGDLGDIRQALWDIDIPWEHHEQMIALVDEKMTKYRGKEVTING